MKQKKVTPLSVAELSSHEVGVIDAVEGTIRWVGERKQITPEGGQTFTVQPFTIGQLESGIPKIDGDIYDHPDLKDFLAKDVVLASFKSRNGRYGGVKLELVNKGAGLFSRAGIRRLKVSKAGVVHTPDSFEFAQQH